MKECTFGLVGTGIIAETHALAIRAAGGRLVGVCSRTKEGARKFASENSCTAYDSFEAMLADSKIDTVSICTPSGNHFEQAEKALLAGKNVVVEKPICLSLSDCDKLIKLADEKKLALCSISQSRFSDSAQAIKQVVQSGVCGRPVSAQLMMRFTRTQEYYDSASWRGTVAYDGGGVLMNQGIHGIDLLCYLFGKPKYVTGFVKTILRDIEVEDTAVASIEFENGALGAIDATNCSNPAFEKKLLLCFENGTVVLENDEIVKWTLPVEKPEGLRSFLAGNKSTDNKTVSIEYHVREYQNFIHSLAGEEKLLVDGREGRMALSLILGIYEASKTGKRVLLAD